MSFVLLITLEFHKAEEFTHNPIMLLVSLVSAIVVGYIVLSLASKRYFSLFSFAVSSIFAGVFIFMLFYCTLLSMHDANSIQFTAGSMAYALPMSIAGFFIIALLMFWINDYVGKNPLFMRLLFAYLISGLILAIHLTLENATQILGEAEGLESSLLQNEFIGIIISLAFLSLFLLVFVFTLLFSSPLPPRCGWLQDG